MTTNREGASEDRGPAPSEPGPASKPPLDRRIVYLMTFRTGLVTLLFGVIILVALLSDAPIGLTSTHSQAMFGALVLAYASTLAFAVAHGRFQRKEWLFALVLGMDGLLLSVVVHLTGGIQSVWTFLYLLLVVEAAIVGYRRWALWAAVGVAGLFLTTTLSGYGGLLPRVDGQTFLPDRVDPSELTTSLLINLAAQAAIAVLSAFLAEQLRRASANVEQAEESLRDMVRLNEQILESLDGGLVTLDPDGNILQANPAAMSLLGPGLRSASHQELSRALPGLPTPEHGELAPQRLRSQITPPDPLAPPIPVEVNVTALLGVEGARAGSILLIQDLTEIRAMEERIQRAERLAVVGRVAAGIAHEIRNPLAAVSGSLELLRSSPQATPEDQCLLEIALHEVERLDALVRNLLGFARPRPPQKVPFDLVTLARDVASVFGQDPTLGTVALSIHGPENGCPVEADPDQIRQVLWNLLRNAAEATGGTGKIAVAVDLPREATLWLRLRVEDDGPGIEPSQRPHLFEPFYSTKEKGSGLGLATVHRIVEDHGGRVEVEDVPGGGVAMVVLLPSGQSPIPVNPGPGSARSED